MVSAQFSDLRDPHLSLYFLPDPPRRPVCRRGCTVPRRRVEPCGNRALGGGASASPQSFAAHCSGYLSFCYRTDRRTPSRVDSRRDAAPRPRDAPSGARVAQRRERCRRTWWRTKRRAPRRRRTAPTTTTTTAAPASTTTTTAPAPTTTHDGAEPPPPPPTTTDDARRRRWPGHSEDGEATWYSEAPAGDVRQPHAALRHGAHGANNATGASTTCTVDDREEAGYPRVVDMSHSGFSQIADPSQGVVDVTISW